MTVLPVGSRSNHSAACAAWMAFGLALLLLAGAEQAHAQAATGTIVGHVQDRKKAAVAKAAISARELETGTLRQAVTDASGAYRIAGVPVGSYEVTVSAPGFQTEVRGGVAVAVGADAAVNFTLPVGSAKQKVFSGSRTSQGEEETSAPGGVVNEKTIREVPLNGRDWLQLAALQPGVVSDRQQSTSESDKPQQRNSITISGGRPFENAYRLNGLVINDFANRGPGSVLQVNLGVDAIRQFSIGTNGYAADYGRGSGGVVDAVIKSGTNAVHGSLIYFHRNSAWDARNFFDASLPPFRRHQFGGSVGGRIRKDKTFYFANFEALREFKSLSIVSDTLSPNARRGALTSGAIAVDQRVVPYLGIFPLPNGRINGDTGTFIFGAGRTGHENFVVGRMDHAFTNRTTLSAIYTFDGAQTTTPDAFDQKLTAAPSRRQNIVLNLQHVFSSAVVNIARVGVTRSRAANPLDAGVFNPLLDDPRLGFLPGQVLGTLTVTGLATVTGRGNENLDAFWYTAPQVADDLAWSRGRTSWRFGASLERILENLNETDAPAGNWRFGSVRDFLLDQPLQFISSFPGTDPVRGMRTTIVSAYVQNDVRLRPSFTMNFGVRYEMSTVVKEVNGLMSNLRNLEDPTTTVGDPYYKNPTLRNFAPRLGLAWDVGGAGKTVVRTGVGLFDVVPLPYLFVNQMPRSAPFYLQGLIGTPSPATFPNQALQVLGLSTLRAAYVEFHPRRAYRLEWSFSVNHEIMKNLDLRAGYVGSAGVHLPTLIQDIDQVPPALVTRSPDGHYLFPATRPIPRVNTSFGRVAGSIWKAHSSYHAMQAALTKRLGRGLSLQAAYTWQKSIDDASGASSGSDFSNSVGAAWVFDPQANRAVSDFLIPQTLAMNTSWQLPSRRSSHAVSRLLLSGWQIGGVVQLKSGNPFSLSLTTDRAGIGNSQASVNTGAQRPDFNGLPGCKPNAVNPGHPDNYIRLECFSFPAPGVLGNAGRNTLWSPDVMNVDFSLFKNHSLRHEKVKVQFRAEGFNIFNRANFQARSVGIFDSQGRVIPTSPQLRPPTATTSRQIQFGIRFLW